MLKRKVLVIEDEESVRSFLKTTLESNPYQFRGESSGKDGLQAAIEFRPDLIILDLGLPDIEGTEVLSAIRKWSQTPIIILTARESDEDKVKALDSGADDYLTKPFSVPELLARIRVALRHLDKVEDSPIYKNGILECDLSKRIVKVKDAPVKLTQTEFDILRVLIKNAGKVVTHRALLKEIWGPNLVEHTQYLRVYVGQLRKKLQKNVTDFEFIETEPGIGYRLSETQS